MNQGDQLDVLAIETQERALSENERETKKFVRLTMAFWLIGVVAFLMGISFYKFWWGGCLFSISIGLLIMALTATMALVALKISKTEKE